MTGGLASLGAASIVQSLQWDWTILYLHNVTLLGNDLTCWFIYIEVTGYLIGQARSGGVHC